MATIHQFFRKYSSVFPFVFVGLLILALSTVTYHHDFYQITLDSAKILEGNFDIYKDLNVPGSHVTAFSPFAKFLDAFFYAIFYFLGIAKLNSSEIQDSISNYVPEKEYLFNVPLLKLRFLLVFGLILWVVREIAKTLEKDKKVIRSIVMLALFSPIFIFFIFTQANNDIYPVLFLFLFLLLSFKNKPIPALICLGLAAAVKSFPVFLFLPAAIILARKDWKKSLVYFLIPLFVTVITYLPYLSSLKDFGTARGEGLFILDKGLTTNILLFPFLYFLINLYLIFIQDKNDLEKNNNKLLIVYMFVTTSLFYTASFFIPQWYMWIQPFFILLIYKNRRLFYLYCLLNLTIFANMVLNWGKILDYSLFQKASPMLGHIEPPYQLFHGLIVRSHMDSMIYTVLLALFVTFIFILLKNKMEDKEGHINSKLIYLSILPLFAYLFVTLGYAYIYLKLVNKYSYDLNFDQFTFTISEPLKEDYTFYQTFTAKDDSLTGIKVYIFTYATTITSPYKLTLMDSNCTQKISATALDTKALKDGSYVEILFPEINDSKEKTYCFNIAAKTEKVETPISLKLSTPGIYVDGDLTIDGEKKEEDIIFKPIYKLDN